MDTLESKMDKCISSIYDVRLLCYDIIKQLKELKKLHVQPEQPRHVGQDQD